MKSPIVARLAFMGILLGGLPAQAQLIWNPAQDGGVTPGGAGAWSGANNWYNGASNVSWVASSAASFSGTGGNVTLNGNVVAGGITFSTGGWNLISDSSSNRSLTPGNVTVNAGTVQIGSSSAPVSVNLTGGGQFQIAASAELILYGTSATVGNLQSGSLTKTGAGTLTIVGPKSFNGGVSINAGTLSIADFASLGNATNSVPTGITVNLANNSVLKITGTTASSGAGTGTQLLKLNNAAGGTIEVTGSNVATVVDAITGSNNSALTKTGTGTLVLTAGRTATGQTSIDAGTLEVNGTHTAASININTAGTLSGTGTFGAANLNNGGTLAPGVAGNDLAGTSLDWNPGGKLQFSLGATTTNFLTLSGALTQGSAGAGSGFVFDFANAGDFLVNGQTFDLLSFGSTTFSLADFSYTSSINGFAGAFSLGPGNTLQFTVVPEPATGLLLGLGLGLVLWRRRLVRRA